MLRSWFLVLVLNLSKCDKHCHMISNAIKRREEWSNIFKIRIIEMVKTGKNVKGSKLVRVLPMGWTVFSGVVIVSS